MNDIAIELLEQEVEHLRGYDPQDWRGKRLAAVQAELRQLRHQSPLRVWSVTADYETSNEAQWSKTFAVLAENEDEARTYIREYIRSSQVLGGGTDIEISSTLWEGSQGARIIATLEGAPEGKLPGFRWVPSPRSEGEPS